MEIFLYTIICTINRCVDFPAFCALSTGENITKFFCKRSLEASGLATNILHLLLAYATYICRKSGSNRLVTPKYRKEVLLKWMISYIKKRI